MPPKQPCHTLAALVVSLILAAGCGTREQLTPPTSTTFVIAVDGMTCEGCANAITETLEPVPGVTTVAVDHAAGTATVTAIDDPQLPPKLVKRINEIGYDAKPQN